MSTDKIRFVDDKILFVDDEICFNDECCCGITAGDTCDLCDASGCVTPEKYSIVVSISTDEHVAGVAVTGTRTCNTDATTKLEVTDYDLSFDVTQSASNACRWTNSTAGTITCKVTDDGESCEQTVDLHATLKRVAGDGAGARTWELTIESDALAFGGSCSGWDRRTVCVFNMSDSTYEPDWDPDTSRCDADVIHLKSWYPCWRIFQVIHIKEAEATLVPV